MADTVSDVRIVIPDAEMSVFRGGTKRSSDDVVSCVLVIDVPADFMAAYRQSRHAEAERGAA